MTAGYNSALSTKYTTAKAASSNFLSSYLMHRPATALYKALGRFSLSSSATVSEHNASSVEAADQRANGSEKNMYVAAGLRTLFQKLTKYNSKTMKLEKQIYQQMVQWSGNVQDPTSAEILRGFAEVIEMERKLQLAMVTRREEIASELTHVADKEKQKKKRYEDWKRAGADLKQKSHNFGEMSYYAVKQREEIEAIECNLTVLEFQYARSISGGFKDSVFNYASLMHSEMRDLSNAALRLIERLRQLENEIIMKNTAIKDKEDIENVEPREIVRTPEYRGKSQDSVVQGLNIQRDKFRYSDINNVGWN